MSYLRIPVPLTMIEVSLSSTATVSTGSMVPFDTVRATGSHGVTVNSSTGEVSLDTSKQYYIQASVDVSRSSTTSGFRLAWVDSTGTEISASNGGYDAQWDYSNSSNATYTAVYQSTTPVSPIRLKVALISANSTVNLATKLLILEVTA